MPDDTRITLDYAPPPAKRRPLLLMLAFLASHLVASYLLCINCPGIPARLLSVLAVILMFPMFVGYEFGWITDAHVGVILLVLIPLNSVAYAAFVTAAVTFVRATVTRRS